MNLIDSMMTPCVVIDKRTEPDGAGGTHTEWYEGARINAAIVKNNSVISQIAEQQGVTSQYTITTHKNVLFAFHDVIKRLSDGQIFRVTSNAVDSTSPDVSTLDISQVQAEEWRLP